MSRLPPLKPSAPGRSFTLVEILVSISILVLMILAMTQMMGMANRVWRESMGRIDNFTKSPPCST